MVLKPLGERMTDRIDPLVLSRLIAAHQKKLAEMGIETRYGTNFDLLEELLPIDDKTKLTPHFSTALNTYTEANAFWLGGFDSDGQLVALNASRLDDLGQETQRDYIGRYWRRCYPAEHGEQAQISENQPRFWRQMGGRVAYFGDFHLKKAGYQGRGLPKIFAPLCVLLAAQKWNPDWYYCWVRERDWAMRYPMGYGFARTYFPGLRWKVPPASIAADLVAAVNSRDDALDWMDALTEIYE
jgi:hypothetical protein